MISFTISGFVLYTIKNYASGVWMFDICKIYRRYIEWMNISVKASPTRNQWDEIICKKNNTGEQKILSWVWICCLCFRIQLINIKHKRIYLFSKSGSIKIICQSSIFFLYSRPSPTRISYLKVHNWWSRFSFLGEVHSGWDRKNRFYEN